MKRGILCVFALLAAACLNASQGLTSPLDMGTNVKAQSLGGAYSSATDDAAAMFFNPASLSGLSKNEIHASFAPLMPDTYYSYVVFGIPTVEFGAFGFSAALMTTAGVDFRDSDSALISNENQNIGELYAGWGMQFFDGKLGVGTGVKFDFHFLGGYSDTGFGADLGAVYSVLKDEKESLNAGLVIKNLFGPSIKLFGGASDFPIELTGSADYMRALTDDISAEAFLDAGWAFGAGLKLGAGVDAAFFRAFSVRAGFNSDMIFSAGLGLEIPGYGAVDYGFFMTEPSLQHRVSLKYRFGGDIFEERRNKDENRRKEIEREARLMAAKELKDLRDRIDKLTGEARRKEQQKAARYARGLELYYEYDYATALLEFEAVRKLDPQYMNTAYYISLIKSMAEQNKGAKYSKEIIALYKEGVDLYLKEDYAGARASWMKILELDPYNKLAIDNLKEVNSLLREIETKGNR